MRYQPFKEAIRARAGVVALLLLHCAGARAVDAAGVAQHAATADANVSGAYAAVVSVPLKMSGAGSFQLPVTIAGEVASFVLDTGAAMVSIERSLARRLEQRGLLTESRQVAVRLADGRLQRVAVQRVKTLRIGDDCELQDLEVLVLPGKGRNLLGLNALTAFAPLTLGLLPPALGLSGCRALREVVRY